MKVLITGVTGMLGTELAQLLLEKGYSVCGLARSDDKLLDCLAQHKRFRFIKADLCSKESCKILHSVDYDAILHCAAITDVDACESDPAGAQRCNVQATELLLGFLKGDAAFIFISTDYVFSGQADRPYKETDEPGPVNIYGMTKLKAESMIQERTPRHAIVRTSWLYGLQRSNFVEKTVRLLLSGNPVSAFDDLTGNPTYATDLAQGLYILLERLRERDGDLYGIYHVAGRSACSRYTHALHVARLIGGEEGLIRAVRVDECKLAARRPHYSALDTSRFQHTCGFSLRGYEDATAEYVKALCNKRYDKAQVN